MIHPCMHAAVFEPTIAAGCADVGVLCSVPRNLRVVSPRAEPARSRAVTYQLTNRH